MASTLPNLTWVQSGLHNPVLGDDIASVIAGINACITATDWVIHASSSEYLLFGPPTGTAIDSMRILIAGDGTGPNAAQMDGTHSSTANRVYMGIAPDSGKTSLTNAWNSASNPFDTDRFTGYAKISGNLATDDVNSVYAIYSDEVLCLGLYESGSDDMRGCVVGALIAPADDLDGEGTPGRIYGYATSGEAAISNTASQSNGQFFGTDTGQNAMARIFRPDSPTNLIYIDKLAFAGPVASRLKSLSDSTFLIPIIAHRQDAPYNMYGKYRQIGFWQDTLDRVIIQDSVGSDKGYVFASQRSSTSDCWVFYNK
jgi:hypothetical protein